MGQSGRGAASPRAPEPQRPPPTFFPCLLATPSGIPREARKPSPAVLRSAPALWVRRRPPPSCRWPSRSQAKRPRDHQEQQETHHGDHRHLHPQRGRHLPGQHQDALAQHQGPLRPSPTSDSEKAPDLRAYAGNNGIEFGAAWTKRTKDGARAYHSVKLERPLVPGPHLRPASSRPPSPAPTAWSGAADPTTKGAPPQRRDAQA